nr:phosphatase PAP2 family protein [Niveibacterium umoris]
MLVAACVVFLLLRRDLRTAAFVAAATVSGAVASLLLKSAFARPRPDLVPHATTVFTASFPSGHAMLSAVVYLTLGALLARITYGWWQKRYLMVLAVSLTAMIGASRVYLGVHWPSDVLAGWALGAAWALACWIFAQLTGHERGRKT